MHVGPDEPSYAHTLEIHIADHLDQKITDMNSSAIPPNGSNSFSDTTLKATQYLSLPNELPFSVPDKINETLSQIPPPQLIELIANLKNMLNGADAPRAADVFRLSPHLAASATQALLLMGFIDEEVIQEAMKAEAAALVNPTPPPLPPQTAYSNTPNLSNQGYNQNPSMGGAYGQNFVPSANKYGGQNNFNQNPTNPHQNYGQLGNGNRQQQQFGAVYSQHQNLSLLPPPPTFQATPSRWPHLPPLVQMKLANVPEDQAELIVQVLSLTPDQIGALPLDRQNMVAGIRQQYS